MAVPGGSGPIGPYPAGVDSDAAHEDYDKRRRRVLWTLPYGLYVLGSRHGERRNAMTINWVTQVSFDPKMVGVGIEVSSLTHELIGEGGAFSLNILTRDDRAIVRKFTKPVEVDLAARTMNGFGYVEATTGAPILTQCVAFVDCRVVDAPRFGGHTLFVGEIVDAGFRKAEDTAILRMEDTRMNYGG